MINLIKATEKTIKNNLKENNTKKVFIEVKEVLTKKFDITTAQVICKKVAERLSREKILSPFETSMILNII